MNLAFRDIRHDRLRFVLTCVGLSLLLGIVITMTGIYRGALDDALRLAQATSPDLWVVEAGTNGPFAEASRIPGDTREMVARIYGVERAGAVTYQSVQTEIRDRRIRLFVVGFQLGRLGGPGSWLPAGISCEATLKWWLTALPALRSGRRFHLARTATNTPWSA